MLRLQFNLHHQDIYLVNRGEVVATDSKNYLVARFNQLTDDWEKPLTAIFTDDVHQQPYTVLVGENAELQENECFVPWEVLTDECNVYVSVFCGNLHTTIVAAFKVQKSGYIDGETPPPPSPTVYDTIVQALADLRNEKQDVLIPGDNIIIEGNTISAQSQDVSGKEDKANKATNVNLVEDITAEDSVKYPAVKVLKNMFRIIRDNLLSGKADKSEIPTKTSDLTNDSFMPMETVTSINDCTEGDVIYQVSTRDSLFYIFNVLKGVYWTQFKLDLDGIHVRFNEKSGVTGEWQGFDEFRALEDTAMKVSAINSSNQSSEDFYTSVKSVVNYIAAQGFLTQQDISDKVDKVTIPRNTLIAGDGDGGIKTAPYFVTGYKEDIASGIPAGLPNCEAVHASLEDAKTEVTLALDNVNNAVINIENNILPQKADKSEIPTKTSQLANDSNFLTQHQDISGKVDKIYVPNNWLLAADGAGGMKNSQYQVTTYSYDIEDSLPIAVPNCAAVKSSITAAIAQVVNNTLPVETVSSIDSCTENGVLYIVETRDTYFYVLNNIKNAVWLQIKIDSYGISQRWNDKDGTTGEWQGFNSFGYLEDSSLKATAINSSNQGSDDNYPSVKAVVNYVNNHSGVTIQSAVVNQNGTITFIMSNGSTITTTGASVIGPAGDDYILTAQDKTDIANIVLGLLPTTEGVEYGN